MKTIIYFDNPDSPIGNSVTTLAPNLKRSKSDEMQRIFKELGLPESTPWKEVEDGLESVFKNARKVVNGKLVADLKKSKMIAHGCRRMKRSMEFETIDGDNMNVLVSVDAEVERAAIRLRYDTIQINLDDCTSVTMLKTEMEKQGLV